MLRLLVINISSSSPAMNKLLRLLLPVISVTTYRTMVWRHHVDNTWRSLHQNIAVTFGMKKLEWCGYPTVKIFWRWPVPQAWVSPNLPWGDTRPYAVPQRTPDKDCRQAEKPKQLVDEASQFHLGRQRQHFVVISSGAVLFSSRVLRPSLVTLCSHKSGRCAVELYHASHLWHPKFYTSPMASSALQH